MSKRTQLLRYMKKKQAEKTSVVLNGEKLDICIEALEKQVAKKVIGGRAVYNDYGEYSYDTYKCPNCSEEVFYDTITYYCETCGQHLDWSESDED